MTEKTGQRKKKKEQILDRLRKCLPEYKSMLDPDVQLKKSNIDSLDLVEIMLTIEEEFDVILSDDELSSCETVGDLLSMIENKQPGDAQS